MTQSTSLRVVSRLQAVLLAVSGMLAFASATAAPQLNLSARPLYAGGNVPPLVMIDLSKDHTLHQKAYNDYTDLNGDGVLDTTYTNSIDYAGYFDSYKCYDYDKTTVKGFIPKSITTTKYCDGKTWSGNFLNWATMSRIDEVRKILYGGTRSTDTSSSTVLERAFLPMDAHAWAKFYNGSDVGQLVPLTVEVASAIGALSSSTSMMLTGAVVNNVGLNDVSNVQIGDQLKFVPSGATAGSAMTGWVMKVNSNSVNMAFYPDGVSNPGSSNSNFSTWSVTNLTRGGLTLCNVTPKDSSNANSQANTQPPQIRVVSGNYATWGASEKWQCNWYEEASNTQGSFLPKIGSSTVSGSSNGNRAALSGINSSAENPSKASRGLGTGQDTGTFNARVQVCVASLIGTENCKQYGSNYKPYGLLQKYGESGQMLFGLMTGSYDKNISGGVLRQNVTNFTSEIDPNSGAFTYSTTGGVKGIVWNIDKLRPYGYSYTDGSYVNADQCNYQQTGIQSSGGSNAQNKPANEGNCSTWGNPISEIFVETLRYFAGKTANSSFSPASNGKDSTLGLTQPAWANPMDLPTGNANRAPYCSPLNALVFNSSVSSYDNDQLSNLATLNTSPDINTYTNKVGTGEGINGKAWFAGGISGGVVDNLCSAKTVSNFSDVLGICPEGPSQMGTFQIAGAALFAKTNQLRTSTEASALGVPSNDTTSLKMSTYAVQLATNTPKISVNVNGKTVTIMPAYQLHPQSPNSVTAAASTGTLVDFKVISQTATSGKFYVNWEDSIAGGDYDQDVWGILSYSVSGDSIAISTRVVSGSSANGQGFGYTISGTDKDGPHFHSGIYDFQYNDPANIKVTPTSAPINGTGGCNKCNFGDPETSVSYTANGKTGSQFLDPLQYAAKWGGFKDLNGTNTPDQTSEWDVRLANGQSGSDGLPDNYFYATNPGALAAALERAFLSILKTSSASSVATNSSTLQAGSRIYQARFNGTDWSGQVLAYQLNTKGVIQTPEVWDAGAKLANVNQDNRKILTFNGSDNTSAGIPFRWNSLPTAYKTALNQSDTLGSKRVLWLRGDQTNEGDGSGQFRTRPATVLGDIVNSNPQYVGPPRAGYIDASYASFVASKRTRKPMLYVGGNDGMLHAFSADATANGDGGQELFAYVPSALYGKLANLTANGYVHSYYVDGSPSVTDAFVNNAWKSVLVSGLGAGGKGVFALDVTDPDSITENTAASTVLWEFTNANDDDLGYTFGKPKIVKLGNGKWAAVFGNGYNSTAARASIFIVFLDRQPGSKSWVLGTDYLKLTVDDATATASNGAAQVYLADVDGNGSADYLYAGDLLGNVWKWDVTGSNAANYQSTRQLLFKATDSGNKAQPITSSFSVMRHPSGGYLVTFGTGRYIDTSDPANMSTQTIYGLWDQGSKTQPTITRSKLVQQTINQESQINGAWYRLISQNKVTYTSAGFQGWYMDLLVAGSSGQGERVVYDPQIDNGRVLFSTLIPSTNPCDNGGSSWLMALDALSGGRLPYSPYDVNGDGRFDNNDLLGKAGDAAGGTKFGNGITSRVTTINGDNGQQTGIGSDTSGNLAQINLASPSPTGRLSWREILH